MPFWRRRRDETPEDPSAATPTEAEPEAEPARPVEPEDVDAGWEPDPSDFDDPMTASSPADVSQVATAAGPLDASVVESTPPATDVQPPALADAEPVAAPPAFAPFDPTAFLAVAPAHTLDQGLERTRTGFMSQLRGYLGGDDPQWDDVEETLIAGDVGATLAIELVERARRRRDPGGAEAAIRAELAALLVTRDLDWSPQPATGGGPAVVLVIGVNGTGKTTTIGKLAARYAGEGRTVILAAADTFRAAAIDQLRIWADRAGVPVVAHAPGADPGAVVFDALDAAVARGADLVIADTAGRLHTKTNLMDELAKVRRIIDKRLPGAEPETLFVLDATTGQNGLSQAKAFHDAVGLTGIVLTKLDSTAKGGIVFAIEDALKVPVRFVGVGEGVNDLLVFDPDAFVAALFTDGQAPTG
ncbi:MAG TPA: signal recognition particle-docking protein FtsY [Candidatus Saccharimonadales bacterium]|nr:signal recognition particle-docking protein FtsY [Candidatus Saccharimonadales bacterium]